MTISGLVYWVMVIAAALLIAGIMAPSAWSIPVVALLFAVAYGEQRKGGPR